MRYRSVICFATLLAAGAGPAQAGIPVQAGNVQATQPSDLPVHTYVIQGKPSDVVQNHEDVRATLDAMKRGQESASKAQVIGSIVAGVDPAVKDGQISQPVAEALVGAAMNLAPDGRFLIFSSARDGKSADLYVTFPDARGGWGTPINLGPAFNSPYDEYGANLSADGKYLFFTRHTPQGNRIYWVAVSAIEQLKPR
jgi:hypothetical protein